MTSDARKIRLILDLRRAGISDTRVLAALERIPRHVFTPDDFKEQAYENTALPIGCHQTISAPVAVAQMTQALQPRERSKVLEVGTGSGYQAAILSQLCRRVYTIERFRELRRAAEERFAALRISNITSMVGDGTLGWPEQAPFEHIIVTAAATDVPPLLAEQLAEGGIMVVPIDDGAGGQRLLRVRRTGGELDTEDLGPMRFVPLVPGPASD